MTKKNVDKVLGMLFNLAKDNPTINIRFDRTALDTIERLENLEKEDHSPSLKET